MTTVVPARPAMVPTLPAPGAALHVGNVASAAKLSEKTIELTACAQFGNALGRDMVWFGLTQKQERQHGFDTSTNLGGHAFILQFKASATIRSSGTYAGQRRFMCQHDQMQRLRTTFGGIPNSCFYFFPNIGRFEDLVRVGGDVIGNAFLADVADLPPTIPITHRKNGCHYAFLDASVPQVTLTSQPFEFRRVWRARDFARKLLPLRDGGLQPTRRMVEIARVLETTDSRLGDLFFKNAALVVLP